MRVEATPTHLPNKRPHPSNLLQQKNYKTDVYTYHINKRGVV